MDPIATYFAEARRRAEANDKLEASQPAPSGRRKRNAAASNLISKLKKEHYIPCNYEPPLPLYADINEVPLITNQVQLTENEVFSLTDLTTWSVLTENFLALLNTRRISLGMPIFTENKYYQSAAINFLHNLQGVKKEDRSNPFGSTTQSQMNFVGNIDNPWFRYGGTTNANRPTDEAWADWWINIDVVKIANNNQIGICKLVRTEATFFGIVVGPTTTNVQPKSPPSKTIFNPTTPLDLWDTRNTMTIIPIDSLPYRRE